MTWATAATRFGVAVAHNIPPQIALSTDPAIQAFGQRAIEAGIHEAVAMHKHLAACIINELGEAMSRGR